MPVDDAAPLLIKAFGKKPNPSLGSAFLPDAVEPPDEHRLFRWHWLQTQYGYMAASWNDAQQSWDISGHIKASNDPDVVQNWHYKGPAFPPEG